MRDQEKIDHIDGQSGDGPDRRNRAAVALNAKRRIVEGTCVNCGESFEGVTTKKYCGDRCRMQYRRAKAKEADSEK